MKFVREMLHNTLKFPEFEVVTLEALIWKLFFLTLGRPGGGYHPPGVFPQ